MELDGTGKPETSIQENLAGILSLSQVHKKTSSLSEGDIQHIKWVWRARNRFDLLFSALLTFQPSLTFLLYTIRDILILLAQDRIHKRVVIRNCHVTTLLVSTKFPHLMPIRGLRWAKALV